MTIVLEMFQKLSEGQATIMAQQEVLSARVDAIFIKGESSGTKQLATTSSYNRRMSPTEVTLKGRDTNSVPRYIKLEFPTYAGKTDPLGWLTC